jgi:hypothetical protein
LLEASPTALLFGAWHSTGEGGGLGAKFPRCLVSEIVAVNTPVDEIADPRTGEIEPRTSGRRTGSRIDPLGVLRKVEVFKSPEGWDVVKERAGRGAKLVRPSEINHGNIAPSVQPLGVTCDHAEHVAVISFAALRRLSFGGNARDRAGRACWPPWGWWRWPSRMPAGTHCARAAISSARDARRSSLFTPMVPSIGSKSIEPQRASSTLGRSMRPVGPGSFSQLSRPARTAG